MDGDMRSVDILSFPGYLGKLEANQQKTGLRDAVITGTGKLHGRTIALGVMDFGFNGGSMGSVVGEKLTRVIEKATQDGIPVIICSTSGGARMYEGMFSLMQMAKTCGALAYHGRKKLPFISVLTDPTMAGVMASFASVGDLILAEPGARIGFAGPRVIKDTTKAEAKGLSNSRIFARSRFDRCHCSAQGAQGAIGLLSRLHDDRPRIWFGLEKLMGMKNGSHTSPACDPT